MNDQRVPRPVTDEMLNRELQTMLAVEPSPEFVARLRERIGKNPLAFQWLRWDLGLATALVVVVAAGAIAWRTQATPPASGPQSEIATRSVEGVGPAAVPTALDPISVRVPSGVTSPGAVAEARPTNRPGMEARALPEVMVADYEAAALRLLLTRISDGRLSASTLGDAPSAPRAADPVGDLLIQPLTIEPLARLDLLEGDRP